MACSKKTRVDPDGISSSSCVLGFVLIGENAFELIPLGFLGIWQIHYIHRAFIFPHRKAIFISHDSPTGSCPGEILFNTLNAYINARLGTHFGDYGSEWLRPSLPLGLTVSRGWLGNPDSDNKLGLLKIW
ncbi:MAG: hypothetical protein Ct9H300mP19_19240 [Dehalococcoidia bacterium]|nr:MAG: hypothetical protein Ct9H300mP19_19240 [Dehalococcoidia bacterium]